MVEGRVFLPKGPGLGIELDRDALGGYEEAAAGVFRLSGPRRVEAVQMIRRIGTWPSGRKG
jgi:hypothetical protein